MTFSKIVSLILLTLLLSCVKYSFRGALPSYLKSIYIAEFDNQTQYDNVREEFMQQTTKAFIDDNSLQVIDNEKSADLILEGSITSITRKPVSITAAEQVQEFHMVVTVRAECMNTHTQKPLWSGNLSRYGIISGTALTEEIDAAIADAVTQIVDDVITKTIAAW